MKNRLFLEKKEKILFFSKIPCRQLTWKNLQIPTELRSKKGKVEERDSPHLTNQSTCWHTSTNDTAKKPIEPGSKVTLEKLPGSFSPHPSSLLSDLEFLYIPPPSSLLLDFKFLYLLSPSSLLLDFKFLYLPPPSSLLSDFEFLYLPPPSSLV